MLTAQLITDIESRIEQQTGTGVSVYRQTPVSGGDINAAYRLDSAEASFFVKLNSAARFPGMFKAEAQGLQRLQNTDTLFVPTTIATGEVGDQSYLVLEWAGHQRQGDGFWTAFGRQLARLHQNTQAEFGLDHDNYIGSLAQSNRPHSRWAEFFIAERLEPQLRMVPLERSTYRRFQRFFGQVEAIFPAEPPALLHGDLWRGNTLVGPRGQPGIIDPAIYYGHREMDLAMTRLFGGFDSELYARYQEAYPLESGWRQRVDLCNLYPLLVHVNLFGGGYLTQVQRIIGRF